MARSPNSKKQEHDEQLDELEVASKKLDLAFKTLELRAGYVELVRRAVLIVVVVALATVTIICALHGADWFVPTSTGGMAP
jgi:hypothetical protein